MIIAENNHVLSFLRSIDLESMDNLHILGILPDPQKIGVNNVSTFRGFAAFMTINYSNALKLSILLPRSIS